MRRAARPIKESQKHRSSVIPVIVTERILVDAMLKIPWDLHGDKRPGYHS
jgi:hypothetical protein